MYELVAAEMFSGMPNMTSALFGNEYFKKKIRNHQIILKNKEIADNWAEMDKSSHFLLDLT